MHIYRTRVKYHTTNHGRTLLGVSIIPN